MSRRAYAAARGVDDHAIRKAIKSGKIVPTAEGLVDPAQADRNWYDWSQAKARDHPEPPQPAVDLSDDHIRRYLAEDPPPRFDEDRIISLLEELKREIAALRKDLREHRPYIPGLSDAVETAVAGVRLDLSVIFHQLLLAIQGQPLTLSPSSKLAQSVPVRAKTV
jgi:hypothetical protein